MERLVEMVDKLEEDVFDQEYPTVHGRRTAYIQFGDSIDVQPERGRQAARKLTQSLQSSVQAMLDDAPPTDAATVAWRPRGDLPAGRS